MTLRQKINFILSYKEKLYLIFLLLGSIILSFLEIIGIGSIGIFVAILSDSQTIIEKIPFEELQIILKETKIESLIVFSGILLMFVFIFKNLVIIIYNYPKLLWLLLPLYFYWTRNINNFALSGKMNDDPVKFVLTNKKSIFTIILMGSIILIAQLIDFTEK